MREVATAAEQAALRATMRVALALHRIGYGRGVGTRSAKTAGTGVQQSTLQEEGARGSRVYQAMGLRRRPIALHDRRLPKMLRLLHELKHALLHLVRV